MCFDTHYNPPDSTESLESLESPLKNGDLTHPRLLKLESPISPIQKRKRDLIQLIQGIQLKICIYKEKHEFLKNHPFDILVHEAKLKNHLNRLNQADNTDFFAYLDLNRVLNHLESWKNGGNHA